MGNACRSTINELKGVGFDHEAQQFLIRFSLPNDGFSIETCVEQNLKRWRILNEMVAQDQSIVHIAKMSNKKVMIGQNLFKVDGPNLFANGYQHEAEFW